MSVRPVKTLFDNIFEENNAKIFRFALKLTGDEARAQEITQRCFIRLWENIHQVQEGQDIFPLLFVYVKHLVIDESRKLYRERKALAKAADEQKSQSSGDTHGERLFIHKEIQAQLHKVVKQMPEQRRNVYVMSRQHGYSHKEIASKLSISAATVRNHLTVALQYIRQELMTHFDADTSK